MAEAWAFALQVIEQSTFTLDSMAAVDLLSAVG